MAIRLIVGLGNPGAQYAATRHNAGFWLIDQLSRDYRQPLQREARFHGAVAKIKFDVQDIYLLEPHTFMNLSGQSVAALTHFYKIEPAEVLVVHDELDLAPGVVKFKEGGSAAGHNGIKSIIGSLGTPNFWRLRIGIGHPRQISSTQSVLDFVLQRPNKIEAEDIQQAIEQALVVLPLVGHGDFAAAMMQLHTRAN